LTKALISRDERKGLHRLKSGRDPAGRGKKEAGAFVVNRSTVRSKKEIKGNSLEKGETARSERKVWGGLWKVQPDKY